MRIFSRFWPSLIIVSAVFAFILIQHFFGTAVGGAILIIFIPLSFVIRRVVVRHYH